MNKSSTCCVFRTIALALLAGVASWPPWIGMMGLAWAAEPVPRGAANVDEMLVVDCLLPGQIRRLGRQLTFLAPRRAIKTSGRDCEIRGGEYVSYDRANYATALKVWLPLAQQGDPAAQTYVGEIFEKGLGVSPDYAAAAEWYRRAAEKGHSRAAINLGNLYERGLGVPQDSQQALNWYRRAAGLGDLGFAMPSSAPAAAEMHRLRQEVDALRSRLQAKEGELNQTQSELGALQKRLEQRSSEVDSERGGLARMRRDLEESRAKEQAAASGLRELERSIAENESRVAAKDREVAALREALARREKQVGQQQAASDGEVARLQREVGRLETEAGGLARVRQELEESRKKERAAAGGLRELERSIAENESRVAAKDREVAALREALARREKQVGQQQAASDGEVARLQREVGRLETEAGGLARVRQELEESRKKERAAAGGLRELERSIVERQERLAAKDRELAELREALARREKEAGDQRGEVERLRQRTASAGQVTGPQAAVPPVIEMIEPELIVTRDISVQGLRVQAPVNPVPMVGRVVSADGLKSLMINGREETLDKADLFKTQIPLTQPEERVRIVAIDRSGRKSTVEFLILDRSVKPTTPASPQAEQVRKLAVKKGAFGNYHALVIGNISYRQLPRLKTAVNDANEIARILREKYGFHVTLLLNGTRYEMLSALNDLRQKLTEKDNLLIYYAGHGELDQINQRGHWLPVDAEPNSSANWISNIAVSDILNAMNVRQLLVVADSCYAGTLTRSSVGQVQGAISDEERLKLLELMAQKRSRLVMTSGGIEPVIDSAGGPHSVFAQAFIELLATNASVLPGQELFRLLRMRVAAAAQRVDISQVPEYAPIKFAGHESGDFFFVRLTTN